jgi:hypothetical protein
MRAHVVDAGTFCVRNKKEKTIMKKNVFLIIIMLLSIEAKSQTPIEWVAFNPPIVFDFEDRDANNHFFIDTMQTENIWQIAIPNKSIFNSSLSGNIALITDSLNFYPTNNESSFIIQLFSDDHTELMFNHKYDFDEGTDGGIIEVSFDNGNTWMNIIDTLNTFPYDIEYNSEISSYNNLVGYSGSSNGWKTASFYFNYPQNGTMFKFTLSSDAADNQKEGWMIDDLQFWILGTSTTEIERTKIKVFPNPIIDFTQIHFEEETNFNFRIIDISGRTIMKENGVQSSIHQINTSKLGKGVFILEIEKDKEMQRFKLVK